MCNTLSIGLKSNDIGINYVDINYCNQADLNLFCEALADYIMRKYEKNIVHSVINRNYFYLNGLEKREIYKLTVDLISSENTNPVNNGKYRQKIKENLFDYIGDNKHIILDGFVTFRLGSYVCEIEQFVDAAVDKFVLQKEHEEFVKLLRYFVEMQDSVYNTVHICVQTDKSYSILNHSFLDITQECVEDFLEGLQTGQINHDDVLISALISLAPKTVHFHNMELIENKQLIDTIKNIFVTRLHICTGCRLCASVLLDEDLSPNPQL